ncbi:YggT family protein [Candidatus Peregrinibacteria bacterium]|nr:YggT family protein [Candidatus Peregrinibacteria bacterium]
MEFASFFLINLIRVLKYAILARVLMSWIQPVPSGKIGLFLYNVTEPVLRAFRSFLPRMGMIDFSPIIAFIAFDLTEYGLFKLFASL